MIRTTGRRVNWLSFGLATSLLLTVAPIPVRAGVDAPVAAAGSASSQSSKIEMLEKQIQQLQVEVGQLREQSKVEASDQKTTAPKTIGQNVASLASDLGAVKKNLSDNLGIHVHGMLDATYEYNFNQPDTTGYTKGGINSVSTGGSTNQLRVFDTDANGFTLQQFNLHIDRTQPEGVGFVADLNFGQVANVLRGSTRYSNINPASTSNGIFDPTQLYMTYTAPIGNGINFSLGRFVTLLGEEVIDTYNQQNYNESRDFIFGFGIPFTHTGLRAQYTFNDKVGVTVGVNNGWDDVSSNNDGQTVEGQLSLTPFPSLSLVLNGIFGPEQVNRGAPLGAIDPIITWTTPIPGLQFINEYLYASEGGPVSTTPFVTSNGNPLYYFPSGPDGTVTINHGVHWQGDAAYIIYNYNDRLQFATRGEWFDDPNGARTGLAQSLGEFTETLNYRVPRTSLLARLEYRHDISGQKPFYSNDGFVPGGSVPVLGGPLPAHTYSGQDTVLAAVIYTF